MMLRYTEQCQTCKKKPWFYEVVAFERPCKRLIMFIVVKMNYKLPTMTLFLSSLPLVHSHPPSLVKTKLWKYTQQMWKSGEVYLQAVRVVTAGGSGRSEIKSSWLTRVKSSPNKVGGLAARLSFPRRQEIRSASSINRKLKRTTWVRQAPLYPDPPHSSFSNAWGTTVKHSSARSVDKQQSSDRHFRVNNDCFNLNPSGCSLRPLWLIGAHSCFRPNSLPAGPTQTVSSWSHCSLIYCFRRDGRSVLDSLGMTETCNLVLCCLPTVPVGSRVWVCFHSWAPVSIKLFYRWCSH